MTEDDVFFGSLATEGRFEDAMMAPVQIAEYAHREWGDVLDFWSSCIVCMMEWPRTFLQFTPAAETFKGR
jgi:hypothetical protein